MDPSKDELSEQELDQFLKEWKAPRAPAHLRSALFPGASATWWRLIWSRSIRLPLPAAAAIALSVVAAVWWRPAKVETRVEVRTERVEVPVVREAPQPAPVASTVRDSVLRPVKELKPIIIGRTE